jgi:hypothetical protein
MASYTWKQNDTGPTNITTLLDRDGNAANLTGATAVRFHMRRGGDIKIDASAEVVDEATGQVRYLRTAADTDTAGDFEAEYEVTYSNGHVQTFPEDGYIGVSIIDDVA